MTTLDTRRTYAEMGCRFASNVIITLAVLNGCHLSGGKITVILPEDTGNTTASHSNSSRTIDQLSWVQRLELISESAPKNDSRVKAMIDRANRKADEMQANSNSSASDSAYGHSRSAANRH